MLKNKWNILLGMLVVALLGSCQQEEIERPFIRLLTLPVTNIDSTGGTLSAELLNANDATILDHGFIWSDEPRRLILNSPDFINNQISLGATIQGKSFSTKIVAGLKNGVTYYVRAYVRTSEFTIYGEQVLFTSKGSLPPRITGILPSIITPGDTMIINGNNFAGAKENMKVVVNKENLRIISATASQIKCIVPRYISGFNSEVVVTTITGEQTNPFPLTNISVPELFRLIPNVIAIKDTVVIEGRFFPLPKSGMKLLLMVFA